jgi:hypothetical protein
MPCHNQEHYGRDRYRRIPIGDTLKQNAGGVAMAMALSGNSLPDGKRFSFALGAGTFSGEYAMGASGFLRVSNNIVLSSGVAFQERQVRGRAGVMVAW